ncbi:MAG: C1 family peptidase [Bacteriovoracaceae bacterium]
MLWTLLISSAFAGALNVQSIQKNIKDQGLQWTAKESIFTRLSIKEIKRLLGAETLKNTTLKQDYFPRAAEDSIDWRNVNGVNWLGPVMNQANCGSCVAFATVATLEGQVSVSSGQPWYHPAFSPQALFGCGGGKCDSGWFTSSGASYVAKNGVPDMACLPYTSGSSGKDVACKSACGDIKSRSYKALTTYSASGAVSTVIAALKKGPLITQMNVYSDFVAYSGGIYKSTSSTQVGGHAISLVGYNATERYWIIRNSWGVEWGEKGFARISWDDKSGIGSTNYGFTIAKDDAYVNIASPLDGAYISDLSEIKVIHSNSKEVVKTVLKNTKTNTVYNVECIEKENNQCAAQIEQGIPDGTYEVYAERAGKRSVIQRLNIVNELPANLSVRITSTNIDWMNLKGRIEIALATTTSSVPLQAVELVALDSSGKVAYSRTQGEILPSMLLGFRTTNMKNGNYEMFYRGHITVQGKDNVVESQHIKIAIKN